MLAFKLWVQTYLLYIKLAFMAATAATLFGSGWAVKGWKDDAAAAAQELGRQETRDVFHEHEAAVAALLEDRLSKLSANKTTVEIQREKIIDRPVYRNFCLDDDGLRLVEAARVGAPAPGKSASQVP